MISYSYIVAVIGNIICFMDGTSLSWSSPVLSKFNITTASEYPFDHALSTTETSLLSSFLSLGAIFGPFATGFCADKFGRKLTILGLAVPFLAAYIIMIFARAVALFYVARILVGFSVGGTFTVMPMYITEIADDSNRGPLGSYMNLLLCFGLVISYSLGPYIPLVAFHSILAAVSALFMLLFFLTCPESPHFHVAKGNLESAKTSLVKLRGNKSSVEKELEDIKETIERSGHGSMADLFKSRGLIKALIISMALVSFQQFSGINAVLFNAQTIFEEANTGLEPAIASIIVGGVQFGSSFVTPTVSNLLGRKPLLILSAAGMVVSEIPLGLFFYLSKSGHDVSAIGWLPVVSLVAYIITYNCGFGPLPWAVMGELFPPHVKSVASSLTASFCWFLSFLITMFFPSISQSLGMGPCFWIFAGFCVAALPFCFLVLVETKGKSLQEIQESLEK